MDFVVHLALLVIGEHFVRFVDFLEFRLVSTGIRMASAWSGMSVRQVILALQRGQLRQVEQKLSACMLCGKCTMVCPRGINTRNLILAVSREFKKEEAQ